MSKIRLYSYIVVFASFALTLTSARGAEEKPSTGDGANLPTTGRYNADLAPFDKLMVSFIREHKVPGAALAVARNGKLLYARGFGYADVEKREPVAPASLFRIASISKPITAVAVMQFVERGKLKLDDKVFALLDIAPNVQNGAKGDARLSEITIRHCLQHRGGWDRDVSFDPMFRPILIASNIGMAPPAGPREVIRYMLGQPLDFSPGERYAYSNFGFCVLGRVIEKLSGKSYEQYVQQEVLAKVGARDMRIGSTLETGRAKGEVKYYGSEKHLASGVIKGVIGKQVPVPYGGWYLEAMDSHGGWIASAPDLVRFASALDDPKHSPLLWASTIATMFQRPEGKAGFDDQGKPKPGYYACGWQVRAVGDGKINVFHSGLLSGTSTLLVRRYDGLCWAVLFNTDRSAPTEKPLSTQIDRLIHEAADQVKQWPDYDLFAELGIVSPIH